MKQRPKINGDLVRQERVRRAWTQEELSERSKLGLRTLRRLESGQGSLESLRRVTETLGLEPARVLASEPPQRPTGIQWDLLRLELSSSLFQGNSAPYVERLIAKLGAVRRHLGQDLGILLPGVRLNDIISDDFRYILYVREKVVGDGLAPPGGTMATATDEKPLRGLRGEIGADPIHGNPAVWLDPDEHEMARSNGCLLLSDIDLIAAHLTHVAKANIDRLLGIEAVASLLDDLHQPRLVAEAIPGKVSLTTLRNLLRRLLAEGHSIRDLGWVLETLVELPREESDVDILLATVVAAS